MRCCVPTGTISTSPEPSRALVAVDDDPERALEHLVALLLARVQVVAHREPARHELELVLEHVAAGLGGRAEEDEPLARRRVLEHVACTRHAREPTGSRSRAAVG